jgi:hypothetical protein
MRRVTRVTLSAAKGLLKGAALVAFALAASYAPASAATTPKPSTPPPIVIKLPNTPLHAEYLVEVNKYGQVVRVKSGKGSTSQPFNTQTFGNAQQMFIRKADGTAPPVGLYKVSYDYNPKTHSIKRSDPVLVSAGGSWADEEGAANKMVQDVQKAEQQEAKERQQESRNLPSLKDIIGSPSPKPSPRG